MSDRKTIGRKEIKEVVWQQVKQSIIDAIKKMSLEDLEETIQKGTRTGEKSNKADRLIEEFTRRIIDERDMTRAMEWVGARAEDLGNSENYEDLREAVRINYFRLGFIISKLLTRLLSEIRPTED